MNTPKRYPKGSKKLTEAMTAGLKCLSDGTADFYDLSRAGCNGVSSSNLVKFGLARKSMHEGANQWLITDAGQKALADGYYTPELNASTTPQQVK